MSSKDYEVIVVDNASTDDTSEMVQSLMKENKQDCNLRYVYESTVGLSVARNRGIEETKGDIIAYIDDDAIADTDWLNQHWMSYSRNGKIACVGGRVIVRLPGIKMANWFSETLLGVFGKYDMGEDFLWLEKSFPYGLNISFKKSVLCLLGGFDTNLGIRGGRRLAGEESDMCLRIYKNGFKILYNPRAIVYHLIEPERISKHYFRKSALNSGYSDSLLDKKYASKFQRKILIFKYLWITLLSLLSLIKNLAFFNINKLFISELEIRRSMGKIWGNLIKCKKL